MSRTEEGQKPPSQPENDDSVEGCSSSVRNAVFGDPGLDRIAAAWPIVPAAVRAGILAMVDAAITQAAEGGHDDDA